MTAWRRSAGALRRLAVFGLMGGLAAATGGGLSGAGAWRALPATEPAATCDVPPRSFEEVADLAEWAPESEPAVGAAPEGEPVDAETAEAITATLEEMATCLTAGQMLRFYALHSDDWLRRFAGQVEGITTLTTSTVPLDDGDRAVYLGPWRVQRLPDGRVMAATLLRVGVELRPDPGRVRVLVFVERGGRWLVDETIQVVWVPGCVEPVEVAAVVGPPPGAVFDRWAPDCQSNS
jgi:hypothetical protein